MFTTKSYNFKNTCLIVSRGILPTVFKRLLSLQHGNQGILDTPESLGIYDLRF